MSEVHFQVLESFPGFSYENDCDPWRQNAAYLLLHVGYKNCIILVFFGLPEKSSPKSFYYIVFIMNIWYMKKHVAFSRNYFVEIIMW